MAIRHSAASQIVELIGALSGVDAVGRETAAARLAAIGSRVVPHLIAAFPRTPSQAARAAMLKTLDSLGDHRGVPLAAGVLEDTSRDAAVAAAALALLGRFLHDDRTQALEVLSAVVVDPGRPVLERLGAWHILERLPAPLVTALQHRLMDDPDPVVRRHAGGSGTPVPPTADEVFAAAVSAQPVDPTLLAETLDAAGTAASLAALHRLVERARREEADAASAVDAAEWRRVRGVVHRILAKRRSRVALYDAVDTVAGATAPLPDGFVDACGALGDVAAFEALVGALSAVAVSASGPNDEWRDQLLAACRAILDRERLTPRHAAVRRVLRDRPAISGLIFG